MDEDEDGNDEHSASLGNYEMENLDNPSPARIEIPDSAAEDDTPVEKWPPPGPLVVNPESILAERCDTEIPLVVSTDGSPSSPSGLLDSQGLIVDDKQNDAADVLPSDIVVSSNQQSVSTEIENVDGSPVEENQNVSDKADPTPSTTMSWADVIDQNAPPLVPVQGSSESLPQRKNNPRVSQ